MSATRILALETSSARGSVALGDRAECHAARTLQTERRHTGELLPTIDELLEQVGWAPTDVDVLAFSQGPGSFTGLRVAATIARTWQLSAGCRVVGVPSLNVIARNALAEAGPGDSIAAILDARQGKLFGGVFTVQPDGTLKTAIAAELVQAEAWLAALPAGCYVLGDGTSRFSDVLAGLDLRPLPAERAWPDARQVLPLAAEQVSRGAFLAPVEIVPHYLRPPECEEVYEKRRAAARAKRGE